MAGRHVVGLFNAGGGAGPAQVSTRVLTVPNVLSVLRLLVLPWIFTLIVGEQYGTALVVAGIFAATDFVDGWAARRFDQVTRLGQLLDPASDRLFIITIVVAMVIAGLFPLWLAIAIGARDLLLLVAGAVVLGSGRATPPVTNLGKATTFLLMASFPLVLWSGHLALRGASQAAVLEGLGLTMAIIAAALYWGLAVVYGRAMWADRAATP